MKQPSNQLGNRCNVKDKRLKVVIDELKQRVVATSYKLRYEARTEQYVQDRIFQTNQVKLFERLEKENRSNDIRPGSQESLRFWSGIWDQTVTHNDEGKWLKGRETINRNSKSRKHQLQRVKNWKAPGPDGLQGYQIKTFTSCHERIATQLQLSLEMNETPNWLTTGKTILIMKDWEKGNDVTNLRPTTCFPLMWKIGFRRTKDQLIIYKMILRNCTRLCNCTRLQKICKRC